MRKKRLVKKQQKFSTLRLNVVFLFFAILGLAVAYRLYQVQWVKHNHYQKIADSQHERKKEIAAKRGEILIKEGESDYFALATNRNLKTLFVVPLEIEPTKVAELSEKIAKIVDLDAAEIEAKLKKENDPYEVIKRKLTDQEANEIYTLDETGVYLEDDNWRFYPAGDLAAQVVGFVSSPDGSDIGQYGIEKQFNQALSGEAGLVEEEKDTAGRWISLGDKKVRPAKDGDDILLTLDHAIQFKAQRTLENAVKSHSADGGKIIISEPSTGKILAMAAYPSFDPNQYAKVDDIAHYINPNVSSEYECGSVFKAVTMTAGLDSNRVSPNTTYYDSGMVKEAGYEIMNSEEKSYGNQTMTQVIEKSLNTGMIFVERNMGHDIFFRYINKFGFGQKTGIDLPAEAKGNISNLNKRRAIEYYTASFGQGITVTPLQLVMAYGAMANGGELLQPQIVESVLYKGEKKKEFSKKLKEVVISRQSSSQITQMLESNVKNGHGKRAGVPGYRVAGKTGTAQKADRSRGGYLENQTVGSFAGYGPVEKPRFVMLVVIDNPKDVEWAESTAAPVFGEMARFLFDYYKIETTEEYTEEDLNKFHQSHDYLNVEIKKEDEDEENK